MVAAWLQGLRGQEVSGTEPSLPLGVTWKVVFVIPAMGLGRSSKSGG